MQQGRVSARPLGHSCGPGRRRRRLGQGRGDKVVAVVVGAGQRDEQIALRDACGCRSRRRSPASPAPVALAAGGAGGLGAWSRAAWRSWRVRRHGAARLDGIVEGQHPVLTIWPRSWPLPASTRTSPASRSRTAVRIASARSPISLAPGQAGMIAARMAAGSSLRGLSSVTMTGSASRAAMRAHLRPLAGVAVAAAAEHDAPAGRRYGAAAPSARFPARRACGHSRHRWRRPWP